MSCLIILSTLQARSPVHDKGHNYYAMLRDSLAIKEFKDPRM